MEMRYAPPPRLTTYIIEADGQASQTFAAVKASADLLLALNRHGSARLVIGKGTQKVQGRNAESIIRKVVARVDAQLAKSGVPKRCKLEDWGGGVVQVTLIANDSGER